MRVARTLAVILIQFVLTTTESNNAVPIQTDSQENFVGRRSTGRNRAEIEEDQRELLARLLTYPNGNPQPASLFPSGNPYLNPYAANLNLLHNPLHSQLGTGVNFGSNKEAELNYQSKHLGVTDGNFLGNRTNFRQPINPYLYGALGAGGLGLLQGLNSLSLSPYNPYAITPYSLLSSGINLNPYSLPLLYNPYLSLGSMFVNPYGILPLTLGGGINSLTPQQALNPYFLSTLIQSNVPGHYDRQTARATANHDERIDPSYSIANQAERNAASDSRNQIDDSVFFRPSLESFVLMTHGRQGGPKLRNLPWNVDCNSVFLRPNRGSFLVGFWDNDIFKRVSKVKCTQAGTRAFPEIVLDRESNVVISFRPTLASNSRENICPQDHVLTALYSDEGPFSLPSNGKCTKLASGFVERNCHVIHTDNKNGGTFVPNAPWGVQCSDGFAATGLRRDDARLTTVTCCKLSVNIHK